MASIIAIGLALALMALMGVFISLPVMWLWNWLMPSIFGLTTLTFWQALGLSVLCSLLFKSTASSKSSND